MAGKPIYSNLPRLLLAFCLLAVSSTMATAQTKTSPKESPNAIISGQVDYIPPADESSTPARFRLKKHTFSYQEKPLIDFSSDLTVSLVTFPSPVKTPHLLNNTVHCEYFRPTGVEKAPAVVVLHILGGDFPLSRLFCNAMAQRGTAALLLKMPYYGPRRDPKVSRRMISKDPQESIEGMTQAVLDIRRAVAWLGAREEIDSERLGVFGISLGGITGALAASVEPRMKNICLMLAGGDIGRITWNASELSEFRKSWLAQGKTREEFFALMKEIDPAAYAKSARNRHILMLNATEDEIIPKECTLSLWTEFGEPEIVWYDGGHYTVAKHILNALIRVGDFFAADTASQTTK